MSYDISLHKIPKSLNDADEYDFHDLVYSNEHTGYLICDTNISIGNVCALGFFDVFGLLIGGNDHYLVINKEDYNRYLDEFDKVDCDDRCKERIKVFLDAMEKHFGNEERLLLFSGD